ncbi:MAG: hypothetical protein ICV85_15840 [Tolypothrix sp. T3-bin4]|nr:hypothetical protein [Tolypothrix sp. T3-bin4]
MLDSLRLHFLFDSRIPPIQLGGVCQAAVVSLAEIATPEALVALDQAIAQETDKVVVHRITTALEALEVGVG